MQSRFMTTRLFDNLDAFLASLEQVILFFERLVYFSFENLQFLDKLSDFLVDSIDR